MPQMKGNFFCRSSSEPKNFLRHLALGPGGQEEGGPWNEEPQGKRKGAKWFWHFFFPFFLPTEGWQKSFT